MKKLEKDLRKKKHCLSVNNFWNFSDFAEKICLPTKPRLRACREESKKLNKPMAMAHKFHGNFYYVFLSLAWKKSKPHLQQQSSRYLDWNLNIFCSCVRARVSNGTLGNGRLRSSGKNMEISWQWMSWMHFWNMVVGWLSGASRSEEPVFTTELS